MNDAFQHSPSQAADGALFDLIEELTERLNRREPVDLEAVIAAHPEHGEQLRTVWPSLAVLADLRSADAHSALSFPPLTMTADGALAGVLGDFRLLREIGRGGMGIVYEAEQLSLGRTVALKVLPFAGVLDERQLLRFRNEARAAAGLKHPHIVPVYSVGCERGVHYYAMEFVEGRTLAKIIAERRGASCCAVPQASDTTHSAFPVRAGSQGVGGETAALQTGATVPDRDAGITFRTIAAWIVQAADALDYAHSVGIVHRDIKPSNLLLDARGQVWITDFGLARLETDAGLTNTGDVLGTLRYMSPEQALGQRGGVDQRTDIYSLGATLYELLTGSPVWTENDRAELLRHIEHDDPLAPRRLDNTIPAELETIVLKATAKEPASRYPTAAELADDLRRFLEDRPIRARRPSWVERLRKWSRRHRTLVRSLTAAAAVSGVSLIVAGWLVTSERQRSEIERLSHLADSAAAAAGRQQARLHEYVTRINLADRTLRLGSLEEGRAHLDACWPNPEEVDLRGFEWRYLSDVAQPAFQEIGQHEAAAYGIRRSPDGQILASCGADGIRIWDFATGKLTQHLTEHTGDVNRVGFSSDGKWLASTSEDRTAIVWDIESWTIAKRFSFQGLAGGGEFTPDGHC